MTPDISNTATLEAAFLARHLRQFETVAAQSAAIVAAQCAAAREAAGFSADSCSAS